MDFGYFTLSDNRYPDNPRTPEMFVKEIYQQALYAEEIGLNSAWIGEHHFNLLGVNACPNMMLAQLAGATKRIRLGPGVVLLPVHHPLHVAEEWATLDLLSGGRVDFSAGRGYDAKEYAPFGAPYEKSAELFAEGLDILWKAWTEPGKWSYEGEFYQFKDIEIRPRPAQSPLRPYVACFSRPSMELAARNDWNIIFAPFAAAMVYGSLADAVSTYHEECEKHDNPQRRAMCSYFIHIADTPEEETYGRESLIRYFHDALLAAFPSDIKKMPPTMHYFTEIVDILKNMKPESLTGKSILTGSTQSIIEQLKEVEASGVSEVILYFNYGLKPDAMVREQMDRFMREIAPSFDGAHSKLDL
ncbi:MAG: LLM class flavin-dependent oxidoreductase [Alphaproteobacteria bacterium]|jgi:alkanesulfonate monooxygenase SsuD/methylene tetrahydromethanopterin reductase-like flavin-dependent oxidoreductase (luciferase family)|nr:LLM class flavin-dependent oxidoreductase [Alphaproteobacteria bacterium]MBT4018002.1 LLM class flavin-dependent oxidoreductase [Alphaproteobacteria bacterium]MBT6387453.1 LLM class flavin-dependent oxidoreductase [Alphaproteobacteria bacterium]